ncbi:MAG: hypothetical protein JXA67_07325 [Micromonosporaceae bacterium]|nr:hypothetical protein [Micromonosporaceae bacterium]
MDLVLTIFVLGGLAGWTVRRGQLWLPVLCLVLIGMAIVSPRMRGLTRDVGGTLVDAGTTIVSTVSDGFRNGGK